MSASLLLLFLAGPLAENQIFHGWSKDGTWLVYEEHGANELVELYFCATDAATPPSWPAVLNGMDRVEERGLSCVHYLDPNKAPYEWKKQLQALEPALQSGLVKVVPELITDGESPGYVLQAGDKKQVCYASGLRESSRLQRTWFHSSGKWAAAQIEGVVHHCAVALKGGARSVPVAPKGPKKR